MQDLNIELKLDRIRCHDEGDGPGSAEPYLWVVYFKVDGETIVVNTDGPNPPFLQGPPTIVPTPGNHGNLGVNDVDEGDEFAVPSIIGEYRTVMKPIPLTVPLLGKTEVGGMIGCIAVLMEEDNTPAAAIAQAALDRSDNGSKPPPKPLGQAGQRLQGSGVLRAVIALPSTARSISAAIRCSGLAPAKEMHLCPPWTMFTPLQA